MNKKPVSREISKAASAFGKMGAAALKEKFGDEHYKKFSRAGVEARRAKKLEREKNLNKESPVDSKEKVA